MKNFHKTEISSKRTVIFAPPLKLNPLIAFDFSLGRNLRKQSETITSSSDFNIFCLRSDDATTTSSFKFNQFISPVKLLNDFGPRPEGLGGPEKVSKTCPVSP
jgi:hypothetical protein